MNAPSRPPVVHVRPNDPLPSIPAESTGELPWTTWVFGGAALIVTLAAGALFMGEAAPQDTAPSAEQKIEDVTKVAEPIALAITPVRPLDIMASFLDAQERARIWDRDAMLAGIEVLISKGKPSSALTFQFGKSLGRNQPGAHLGPRHFSISYLGDDVQTKENDIESKGVALPAPNCPLEAAFKTLVASEGATPARVAVMYLKSPRHGRPVWLMRTGENTTKSISGSDCLLLRE